MRRRPLRTTAVVLAFFVSGILLACRGASSMGPTTDGVSAQITVGTTDGAIDGEIGVNIPPDSSLSSYAVAYDQEPEPEPEP